MYSKTRPDEVSRICIPENYDGTAFGEVANDSPRTLPERNIRVLGECSADAKMSPKDPYTEKEETEEEAALPESGGHGFLEKLPFASVLSRWQSIPVLGGIIPSRIGTEEILIIATAIFLFFSKSGDKECAIMLGLLLLVTK